MRFLHLWELIEQPLRALFFFQNTERAPIKIVRSSISWSLRDYQDPNRPRKISPTKQVFKYLVKLVALQMGEKVHAVPPFNIRDSGSINERHEKLFPCDCLFTPGFKTTFQIFRENPSPKTVQKAASLGGLTAFCSSQSTIQ